MMLGASWFQLNLVCQWSFNAKPIKKIVPKVMKSRKKFHEPKFFVGPYPLLLCGKIMAHSFLLSWSILFTNGLCNIVVFIFQRSLFPLQVGNVKQLITLIICRAKDQTKTAIQTCSWWRQRTEDNLLLKCFILAQTWKKPHFNLLWLFLWRLLIKAFLF